MKLAKETLHVTLYSLYSGTPKLWLGLQFFIKEESRTAVFKILVRTLQHYQFELECVIFLNLESNNFFICINSSTIIYYLRLFGIKLISWQFDMCQAQG